MGGFQRLGEMGGNIWDWTALYTGSVDGCDGEGCCYTDEEDCHTLRSLGGKDSIRIDPEKVCSVPAYDEAVSNSLIATGFSYGSRSSSSSWPPGTLR